ncbi:MAG: hypothetical protein WAO55_00975 [Candidatus Manganitrophaceae bacterium]
MVDVQRIAVLLLLTVAAGYASSERLVLLALRPPSSVQGFIHNLSAKIVGISTSSRQSDIPTPCNTVFPEKITEKMLYFSEAQWK